MRGFYEKKNALPTYNRAYACGHPIYNMCTLFKDDTSGKGLAVVKLYFDPDTKVFWWGPIEDYLAEDIYNAPLFNKYFSEHACVADGDGTYPTEKLRPLMWALRMLPLHKECYERWWSE